MVKTNYSQAKRQREIAKKQKKEAKRQQKTETPPPSPPEDASSPHIEKPID